VVFEVELQAVRILVARPRKYTLTGAIRLHTPRDPAVVAVESLKRVTGCPMHRQQSFGTFQVVAQGCGQEMRYASVGPSSTRSQAQ